MMKRPGAAVSSRLTPKLPSSNRVDHAWGLRYQGRYQSNRHRRNV
jgi:hypothetical protein